MEIAIIDSDHLTRDIIRAVCSNDLGLAVAFETADAVEAECWTLRLRPQLIVMDVRLQGNGLALVQRLRSCVGYHPRILVITQEVTRYVMLRLERLNLEGVIDKRVTSIGTLKDALRTFTDGGRFYSSTVIDQRLARLMDTRSFDKLLTIREVEVFEAIAAFKTDEEIAQLHRLSIRTVEQHRRNVMKKLSLYSWPTLLRYAVEQGFLAFNDIAG